MREAYAGAGGAPNSRSANSVPVLHGSCTVSPLQAAISDLIRARNPRKTWAYLADVLGLTERAAKSRLAGSRSYTVEELQTLLQSEDGMDVLVKLMADAQPKWWWWAQQVIAVAKIKARRAEDAQELLRLETSAPEAGARRRIKGALDASRSVQAAIDRAETVLGRRGAELDREGDPAARRMARVPDRPVAAAKGGRR